MRVLATRCLPFAISLAAGFDLGLFGYNLGCGGAGPGSGFDTPANSGTPAGADGGAGADSGPSVGQLGPQGDASQPPRCTGLQCQIHACSGGGSTTLSGTVFDPAGKNPLYDVVVYVPNSTPQPFADHATCDTCGGLYTGDPIAATLTGPDGTFTMKNVPDGQNIPVAIQVGKWRKQVVVPAVAQCADTSMPKDLTTLPSKHGPGSDMPKIAMSTGGADSIECLLRRVGIDPSEFAPSGSGDQRVQMFQGETSDGSLNGPLMPGAPPSDQALWTSSTSLLSYDIVILSCEGSENGGDKPSSALQALQDYTYQGGRVFASHFHYYWFNNNPTFAQTANWTPGANHLGDIRASINTGFPKGADFSTWLGDVGALSGGALPILQARANAEVQPGNTISAAWILGPGSQTQAQYLTFNTPLGASPDMQCGRVVYSDLHVGAASNDYGAGSSGDTSGGTFPDGCTSADLSPQEKALEFMLFDLSSCVTPDNQPPQPPPVQQPK